MAYIQRPKVNTNSDDIKKLIHANGIYNRSEIQWYDKFARFGCIDPYDVVNTTREYVFFTKPDLNLLRGGLLNEQLAHEPFFREAYDRYFGVMKQLQKSAGHSKGPFMNLLSNSLKSNLDLPGITCTESENSSTIFGDSITYRKSSHASDNDFEFSLEFQDTKYLEIYQLFKIYDEYIKIKDLGYVTPPNPSYRTNKILHDQFCAYKFIVGEDMSTIIFYAKLYGVYFKSVPRDAFSSMNSGGDLMLSQTFHAEFVEDSNPLILQDFNNLVAPYLGDTDIPIYDIQRQHINGEWANNPYIDYVPNPTLDPMGQYKLKWR